MPELPEVETVRRQLDQYLRGRKVVRVATYVEALRGRLCVDSLSRAVAGRTILGFERRAKYILGSFSDGGGLLLHLGMTGTCRICPAGIDRHPHEHVVFHLADGETWRFVDPRRFGMLVPYDRNSAQWPPAPVRGLGPEPLEDTFDADYLYVRTRQRRTPVKTLLMDQRVVAGIGNIYASEILYRAGIRPGRGAGRLTRPQCARIVAHARDVLHEAIAAGGTTISGHTNVDGSMGRFVQQLQVYGRAGESCPQCGDAVRKQVHAGRSTFYCPGCQR